MTFLGARPGHAISKMLPQHFRTRLGASQMNAPVAGDGGCFCGPNSVRQRIGPNLDVHGARA